MSKVYAMIADGTEEVECLAVVDILRRAGVDTVLVSVSGKQIIGSHKIKIKADASVDDVELTDADLLFLPGGMPGAKNLAACGKVMSAVDAMLKGGKRVAAICAAPAVVLGENGYLRGVKAVCYPGFEGGMRGATVMSGARVVTDGNITTARGLGCAVELGLEIVTLLAGYHASEEIKSAIQF